MMFGIEGLTVLPILLLVAGFVGLIAIVVVMYSEVISKNCKVCGVSFTGARDLKMHMRDHEKVLETKGPEDKDKFTKAA